MRTSIASLLLVAACGGGGGPKPGMAIELLGDGGNLTFAAPLIGDRTTFTLEMWIMLSYPPVVGAPNPERNMIYVESGPGGEQRNFVYVSMDNPDNADDTLGATTLSSWPADVPPSAFTGALPEGVWEHLAYVRDGATLRIYIDGHLAVEGPALTYSGPTPTEFHLGLFVNPVSGNEWGNFIVDDVRVSAIARYDADFIPQRVLQSDVATLSLWHFDEDAGSTTEDATGNEPDAVLSAGAVRVLALR